MKFCGIIYRRGLDIERDVDPHWTRSSRPRQVNRFLEVISDLAWIKHGNRILGDRPDDRHDVNFLNSYLPHTERHVLFVECAIGAFNLARDVKRWSGIQPCTGDSSYGIGAAWAGRDHADPKVIGSLGVVFCSYRARLLV